MFGGSLTAAFIGGALMLEGRAEAPNAEAGADGHVSIGPATQDELLLDAMLGGTGAAALGAGRRSSGDAAAAAEDEARPASGDPVLNGAPAAADQTAAVTMVGRQAGAGPSAGEVPLSMTAPGPAADVSVSLTVLEVDLGGEDDLDSGPPAGAGEEIVRNGIHGTDGDDVIQGTDGADWISAGGGDDVVYGAGGSDIINGNDGDDRLYGGAGNDDLNGGGGNDFLDGGSGYDTLQGGSGDDTLVMNDLHDVALEGTHGAARGGNDHLIVGEGFLDQLPAGVGRATFYFSENFGQDLPADVGGYRQQVGLNIEHLTLKGSKAADIQGDSAANHLTGNSGDNVIYGMAGDDVLAGGRGQDTLRGGAGDDTYRIGLNDNGVDRIFDHEGVNRVVIEGVTNQAIGVKLVGLDLQITANQAPLAVIKGYVGHEDAFAGIDFGQGLKPIQEMLAPQGEMAPLGDLLGDFIASARSTAAGPGLFETGADWLSGFDGAEPELAAGAATGIGAPTTGAAKAASEAGIAFQAEAFFPQEQPIATPQHGESFVATGDMLA